MGNHRFLNNAEGPSYNLLMTEKDVSVSVPILKSLKRILPHNFELKGESIHVAEHWRGRDLIVGSKPGLTLELRRNFFGLHAGDFGRRIIATVEVIEKFDSRGIHSLLLDITKNVDYVPPKSDLVFNPRKGAGPAVEIIPEMVIVAFVRKYFVKIDQSQ